MHRLVRQALDTTRPKGALVAKPSENVFERVIPTTEGSPTITAIVRLKFHGSEPDRFLPDEYRTLVELIEMIGPAMHGSYGDYIRRTAEPRKLFLSIRPAKNHEHFTNGEISCYASSTLALDESAWMRHNMVRRHVMMLHECFVQAPLAIIYGIGDEEERANALGELYKWLEVLATVGELTGIREIRKQIGKLTSEAKYGPVDETSNEMLDLFSRIES